MNYDDLLISKISRISRLIPQVMEKPLNSIDISMQEFRIVGLLIGEKGISQKDLASKLSVKPSTLSVAISKLEGKGYIDRKVSAEDKRINYLTLCEDIDLTEANKIVSDIEVALVGGISKKDIEITKRVLNRVLNNVDNIY